MEFDHMLLVLVLGISILSLGFTGYLARFVLSNDMGTSAMQDISNAIKEGAEAFLKRQYSTIVMLSIVLAVLIFILYWFAKGDHDMAWRTTVAFLFGAGCSALAGYIGMWISIRSNIRTASAVRSSLDRALKISLRGGAVSGITIVAMSLLGAGIPEDDPRNPAVIADLVGDNVGDCAGRGADLFESTAAENIGAMILGVALFPVFGINGVFFPLVARAFGLLATIAGVLIVRAREDEAPMGALNRGYYVTMTFATILFGFAAYVLLQGNPGAGQDAQAWLWLFLAGVTGIITSLIFVYVTQYYTEARYRPVREIAQSSETGPATNTLSGLAVGLEATAVPAVVVGIAILVSFKLGELALPAGATAGSGGFFGAATATMGMLAPAAYILAEGTFGPITDHAAGILER